MCLMMKVFEFASGWLLLSGKLYGGAECNERHHELSLRILFHYPFCNVVIMINNESLASGDRQKPKHVAAGERRYKGFFWIHGIGNGIG